ncbi:MAG: lipid-transfer protein, partial [Proteobacteria bacterium]|nr:lipid-transfer protein [Pseudomonadota bacterium]
MSVKRVGNQLGGRAAIVGIGATEFSKDSGRSEMSLACESVAAAIADAGLEPSDI